jgi:hypothetical protein
MLYDYFPRVAGDAEIRLSWVSRLDAARKEIVKALTTKKHLNKCTCTFPET